MFCTQKLCGRRENTQEGYAKQGIYWMRNESDLKKYVEEEDRLKGNIRSSKIHLDGKEPATGKNLRRTMKTNYREDTLQEQG